MGSGCNAGFEGRRVIFPLTTARLPRRSFSSATARGAPATRAASVASSTPVTSGGTTSGGSTPPAPLVPQHGESNTRATRAARSPLRTVETSSNECPRCAGRQCTQSAALQPRSRQKKRSISPGCAPQKSAPEVLSPIRWSSCEPGDGATSSNLCPLRRLKLAGRVCFIAQRPHSGAATPPSSEHVRQNAAGIAGDRTSRQQPHSCNGGACGGWAFSISPHSSWLQLRNVEIVASRGSSSNANIRLRLGVTKTSRISNPCLAPILPIEGSSAA